MKKFLYNMNYQEIDAPLCALEHRVLFPYGSFSKTFLSNVSVKPEVSPFIKGRMVIYYESLSWDGILLWVEKHMALSEDFIIEYMVLDQNHQSKDEQKALCKALGMKFENYPNFKNPTRRFGVTKFDDMWYFGELSHNRYHLAKHNDKPYSYSNSLNNKLAKVIVNLAGENGRNPNIIDPCCGAGTVLLEGCYAGYQMTGSDINLKMAKSALYNLAHFGYQAEVTIQGIEAIHKNYDAAILDLPYGIFSHTSKEAQMMILQHGKRIAKRLVIVSSENIRKQIELLDLKLVDSCEVLKSKNAKFKRFVWVCTR